MKKLIETPGGAAELEVVGSERFAFVNVTVFGGDGWEISEGMWSSRQDQTAGDFIAGETGVNPAEADQVAVDLLAAWEQSGAKGFGSRQAHRLTRGILATMMASALLGAALTALAFLLIG